MKSIVIACDVMKNNLLSLNDKLDYVFLEQRLHDTPKKMNELLQEEIDKVEETYDTIVLGYGCCSNGVVGLKSTRQRIVIPKADDCITLFLGSSKRYREEFNKEPGTFYLCRGWIEYGADPYRIYLALAGKHSKYPSEWFKYTGRFGIRRYDEETARHFVRETIKNYRRVVVIDNNDLEPIHYQYIEEMMNFLRDVLQMDFKLEILKGTNRLFKKLVSGDWDSDSFLIIPPGEEIRQGLFIRPLPGLSLSTTICRDQQFCI